jgi:hypothetical protein
MPTVRSQSLLAWTLDGTNFSNPFTVPASTVVLVKSAQWFQGGVTVGNVVLRINAGSQQVQIRLTLPAWPQHAEWSGWIALNPGDTIMVYSDQPSTYAWVSGAVLAGPPQVPRVSN